MSSILFWFGLIIVGSVFCDAFRQTAAGRKQRRSVADLGAMVSSVTGKQGTEFIAYGNWCGLGGSGQPLDPVDECCQVHDMCYDLASEGKCKSVGAKGVYQVEYSWSKSGDGLASCSDDPDMCKSTVCMCDAVLTNCFKNNLWAYDSKNLHKLGFMELLQEANWITSHRR